MSLRVLLTTTVCWPSGARLVGAFARVGAHVEALLPAGHVAAQSRYLAARHPYDPLFPRASLRRALADAAPDLIVPCDDRALAHLLDAARRLPGAADIVVRSLGAPQAYRQLVARSAFIEAARALRIEAPQTVQISSKDEYRAALRQFGPRAVLKVDGSWGGEGVAILHDAAKADCAWNRLALPPSRGRSLARAILRRDRHFLHEALSRPKASLSLQQFVPGTPATTAFACWKGRVLASLHMDVLETLHPQGPATVMRRIDCPDMESAAVKLAERFGLSGLHGLDFIRDAGGRAHLIEINPRATQICHLALGAGHDLPATLIGLSPRPVATAKTLIALYPQAWEEGAPPPPDTAYRDVPWDDPGLLSTWGGTTPILGDAAKTGAF
ncbi:MAG TPA: ATP-grasp domain-containing protein [Rhizomicrobium sp.]